MSHIRRLLFERLHLCMPTVLVPFAMVSKDIVPLVFPRTRLQSVANSQRLLCKLLNKSRFANSRNPHDSDDNLFLPDSEISICISSSSAAYHNTCSRVAPPNLSAHADGFDFAAAEEPS